MSKSKRIARNEVAVETVNAEVPANEVGFENVAILKEMVREEKTDDQLADEEWNFKREEETEEEVVIVPETLTEKIARIKAEQDATLKALMEQKKALDEQVKEMKLQEAELKKAAKEQADKDRFEKLQMKLNRPEDSKKNAVINAILGTQDAEGNYIIAPAASMEDVALITGFDQKYVSDTVWGLEKACKLR